MHSLGNHESPALLFGRRCALEDNDNFKSQSFVGNWVTQKPLLTCQPHVHRLLTFNPSKQTIDTIKTHKGTVSNIVWDTIQVLKKVRKSDIAPIVYRRYTLIC